MTGDEAYERACAALEARDRAEWSLALEHLAADNEEVRVDVVERAALSGDADLLALALKCLRPAYVGYAYALSLRAANTACARLFARAGTDLLADTPAGPGERSRLARHHLTRASDGLLDTLDAPSVASVVFAENVADEALIGQPLYCAASVGDACALTLGLLAEGSFDSVVVDDLTRAALDAADRSLAAENRTRGEACLAFVSRVLALHRTYGYGSAYLVELARAAVRPPTAPEVLAVIAAQLPDVALERLEALSWLRHADDLVERIACNLGATNRDLTTLIQALARAGSRTGLERLARRQGLSFEERATAIDQAVAAGETELALWLLAGVKAPSHPFEGLLS